MLCPYGSKETNLRNLYLMTDLEGVAGVMNFEDWCSPGTR